MIKLSYRFKNSYNISYSYKDGQKTLLFFHGYLQAEEVWHPFLKYIPNDYGIISIDLPGHGSTDCFENDFFSRFTEAVEAILHHHGKQKAHVIGHSMGGYIALHLMRTHPQLFKSLTLLHSTPLPDTEKRTVTRKRELKVIENEKIHLILANHFDTLFAPSNREKLASFAELYHNLAISMSAEAMKESVISMANRGNFIQECQNSTIPIQLLAGRHDDLLPISRVDECRKLIPNISYHILENSGHTCFIEEPEETCNLILTHISISEKNNI